VGVEAHAVKTVGDVHLDHVDGTILGVGMADGSEEAVQGAAELHRLGWRLSDSVIVDTIERQVNDKAGSSFTLRHDP
jgi:hypothetical protein